MVHQAAASGFSRQAATHPALAGRSEVEFPYHTEAYWCRRV